MTSRPPPKSTTRSSGHLRCPAHRVLGNDQPTRRGGCAIKKTSRSTLRSRRRGGVQPPQNSLEFDHHPVRSIKDASRYLVEVASTPPRRGGENRVTLLCATRPLAAFFGIRGTLFLQ